MWKIIFSLFILCFFLMPQDLHTVWEDYVSVDAELSQVFEKEYFLQEQQDELQGEIRILQENQSWYNGWINKMRLARKSAAHLELSDSLHAVRRKLAVLSRRRDDVFRSLKRAYQQILLESGEGKELSVSDKEAAISLGQWIIIHGSYPLDFPDYSSILASNFEDEEIRQLLLIDLQSVLETKLILIDSLLTERRSERELVNRLNEFHRDLGLQMESDRDLGEIISEGTSPMQTFDKSSNETIASFGEMYATTPRSDESNLDMSGFKTQITQEDRVDSRLEFTSIDDDISILKLKYHQYHELLRQIEKELAY